ncbi:MAG: signal peptidase I, partial [Pseudomonadota bacterium]
WHPQQQGERWIKRIIAIPGDVLTIDDGTIIVNGETVTREATDPFVWEPRPNLRLTFNRAIETWPKALDEDGRTVETVYTGTLTGDYHNESNLRIAGNNVYVMGDYRDNSLDSRALFHGFLPVENITHRVVGILHSPRREMSMVPVYSGGAPLSADLLGE